MRALTTSRENVLLRKITVMNKIKCNKTQPPYHLTRCFIHLLIHRHMKELQRHSPAEEKKYFENGAETLAI